MHAGKQSKAGPNTTGPHTLDDKLIGERARHNNVDATRNDSTDQAFNQRDVAQP